MNHFNKLTPSEAERLAILLEEMASAQHAIGKILRHGYESVNPLFDGPTNRESLERELGRVYHSMRSLVVTGDINSKVVVRHRDSRGGELKPYLHHQPSYARP